MELPSKTLERIAINTRSRIEGHMLIVMEKSIHEEHFSQTIQTNNKQFQIAVTFLTGYNGNFNVTDKILTFISSSQLLMKMVLYRLRYPLVLTNSKI